MTFAPGCSMRHLIALYRVADLPDLEKARGN